ncbi:MAG: hypothetical protein IIV74_02740 [Alphaproteobacteria bacterium]|nr:hypothetical protein [Alphaproteobacteria bacterium]
MKKLFVLAFLGCGMMSGGALAIELEPIEPVLICLTLDQCKERINCNLGKYCCCPNGTKRTEYKCPTGWTYSSLNQRCERSSTSGTTAIGYTQTTYGTCNYTSKTEVDCYGAPGLAESVTSPGVLTQCFCPCQDSSVNVGG